MSSKKDKFLESAQKFIAKGQLDRAIKEYEQVVALDPSDIRHRQRLAELLVRVNRRDEAIGEYEAIGKYYSDNGYYLKAIAVYKQIQKLDAGNIKISLNLASLNEKQGLTGNALAEYSLVYSYYDKSGNRKEALSILESMIAIDPDNLNTRLKFAETRFAAGSLEKAYEDFLTLAVTLKKRGDDGAHKQVCDRIKHLFPEKREGLKLELLAEQLKGGDAPSALPELREITAREQGNAAAWELLADALSAAGEAAELRVALQKMTDLFPSELIPKERLISALLDGGDTESVISLLQRDHLFFLEQKAYATLESIYSNLLEKLPEDERVLKGLMELYETSGKGDRLAEVKEKLKQTEVVAGLENEPFVEAQAESLLQQVSDNGDTTVTPDAPLATCPASTDKLDPAPQPVVSAIDDGQSDGDAVDFELNLSDDEIIELARITDGVDIFCVTGDMVATTRLQSEPGEKLGQVTDSPAPPDEEESPYQDVLTDTDLELELDDSDFYDIPDGDVTGDELSTLTGLTEDALTGCREDALPDFDDDTLIDLSDDAVSDLTDDAVSNLTLSDLTDDVLSDVAVDELSDLTVDELSDLTVDELSDLTVDELSDMTVDELSDMTDDVLSDMTDDVLSDMTDDVLSDVTFDGVIDFSDDALTELYDDAFADLGDDAFARPAGSALPGEQSGSQSQSLQIDFNALSSAEPATGRVDALSSAVRKGEHLDEEDTETHYNLGIAFKEMGLYDDAINEFQVAARDPARMVDCLLLQGTCCREKGDVERSLKILEKGIHLQGLLPAQLSPIKYELAVAYEATGQKEQALSLYKEIAAVDPAFRDTGQRVAVLQGVECHEHYEFDLIELDGDFE